jgi:predicted DNA-binding transcriptional regulator AlpA
MPLKTTSLLPLPDNGEALIPSRQMPAYIGLSVQTLARWRHEGRGPSFVKIGRKVAYQTAAIRQWLAEHHRASTASF